MDSDRHLTEFFDRVYNVDDVIDALLSDQKVDSVVINDDHEVDCFNNYKNQMQVHPIDISNGTRTESVDEYLKTCANTWFIPAQYKDINIIEHLLNMCINSVEKERVLYEYKLYEERDLIPLLQLFMYLIDTFRENNIVWGVGRGSSVASYILFLLGVHKIDSIAYELDIHEFLR